MIFLYVFFVQKFDVADSGLTLFKEGFGYSVHEHIRV